MATWGPTSIAADADDVYDQTAALVTTASYVGNNGEALAMGFRFLNVTVPAGATIDSATLTLRARNLYGTVTFVHGTFYGFDTDDAPAWNDAGGEPSVVTRTTASLAFDPAAWVTDTDYTYAVKDLVAEIVARAGWGTGNDIGIVCVNNGSTSGSFVRVYGYGEAVTETLTIAYTEASGGLTFAATDAQGTQADTTAGFRTMAATLTDNLNA